MRHLYKTIAIIAVIILIEFLKRIFDTIWETSMPLHHNLLSTLQFLLLLWLIVSLILDVTTFRKLPVKKAIQKSTLVVLILILMPELLLVFLLYHPGLIPNRALPIFRDYYDNFERDIIQLNPKCGRYDSSLFYILIPGKKFAFNNLEFHSDYRINSKGLRDDELSLEKPEIIVLGDSYAMGWGVQQDETFAQQLEKITGKTVLNAAVSSYGTARELKNLYRLDTSRLQFLIIQYSRNDMEENEQFIAHNNELLISPAAIYDKSVQFQYWSKRYFPGKYLATMGKLYIKIKVGNLGKRIFHHPTYSIDSSETKLQEGARNFVDMLYNAPLNFDKLRVLVIDMNSPELMDDRFIKTANSIQRQFKYQQKFRTNLVFIPVSGMLQKDDYYILDPHLRASGHKKLAVLISHYLYRQ